MSNATTPPRFLPFNRDLIPRELAERPQWVVCKIVETGKPERPYEKVPINPHTGLGADTTKPSTWGTLDEAIAARDLYKCDGVGYVFAEDDPYCGIDQDACVDGYVINPNAMALVKRFESYTEYSGSGSGLHTIVATDSGLPKGGNKKTALKIEVYDRKRFFWMTGCPLPGYEAIRNVGDTLVIWHREIWGDPKSERTTTESGPSRFTDSEILNLVAAARNGGKFRSLYHGGDTSDYAGDESSADQALMCHLVFYTRDEGQLERLFSGSALGRRDKWIKRPDYRQRTINKALEVVTETYTPRSAPTVNGKKPGSNGANHSNGNQAHHEPSDEATGSTEASNAPVAEPINQSDLGNARRLVRDHGDDLRFCKVFGKWFVWNDGRWRDDGTDEVVRRAKKTVGAIYAEAANAPEDERKALAKHALKSEGESRIHAMVGLSQSEPTIPILPDELDRDPWMFTVRNGTIDLRTGTIGVHQRNDLITKLAPVLFDSSAECPLWLDFLNRIFAGDADLIAFVKRGLGSSLSGITRDRVLFILHGGGRNGKSTLLEVIKAILGADYAVKTPTETLLTKRDSGIPNDVAKLRGARFVTAAEADEGRRLAEATIKELTGGDTVSARFMRGEFFEFQPAFKMWFATNHRPEIRGTDNAIWDRIRLIPFGVRFVTPEEDPNAPADRLVDVQLRDKLIAEAPGILAWMVDGCLEWQRNGLGYPSAVREATAGYRAEMDVVGSFLDDRCVLHPTATVTAGALYKAYEAWCEGSGEKPMTQRTMGTRLKERGFSPFRNTASRGWTGLTLKDKDGTYTQGDGFDYDASGGNDAS